MPLSPPQDAIAPSPRDPSTRSLARLAVAVAVTSIASPFLVSLYSFLDDIDTTRVGGLEGAIGTLVATVTFGAPITCVIVLLVGIPAFLWLPLTGHARRLAAATIGGVVGGLWLLIMSDSQSPAALAGGIVGALSGLLFNELAGQRMPRR